MATAMKRLKIITENLKMTENQRSPRIRLSEIEIKKRRWQLKRMYFIFLTDVFGFNS